MGVGLGNSMGPAYHKGVPCPWGSMKIPLMNLRKSISTKQLSIYIVYEYSLMCFHFGFLDLFHEFV